MIRAVFDTNVWLGVVRKRGGSYQLFQRAEVGEYTSVTSHPILNELVGVMREDFAFSDDDAFRWWLRLTALCEVIVVTSQLNAVKRDPYDNKFVECAVDGKCQFIVSNDKDLLDLREYQQIEMIKIGKFLAYLERVS